MSFNLGLTSQGDTGAFPIGGVSFDIGSLTHHMGGGLFGNFSFQKRCRGAGEERCSIAFGNVGAQLSFPFRLASWAGGRSWERHHFIMQLGIPIGMQFQPEGTSFFLGGSLGLFWTLNSASLLGLGLSIVTQPEERGSPIGLFFNLSIDPFGFFSWFSERALQGMGA